MIGRLRRDPLERRLRQSRPEPSEQLVRSLADRVSGSAHRRSNRLRLGLAGAVSVAVVVSLSAFGGIGYASAAASHAAQRAAAVVSPPRHESDGDRGRSTTPPPPSKPGPQQGNGGFTGTGTGSGNGHGDDHGPDNGHDEDNDDGSSAGGEYGGKVTVCHEGHTIVISSSALPAHLAHGDTQGACPGGHGKHGHDD